jgi:CDP-diacylglycerol--glycerol-3-phosphate 3-phosphatidyltransferase
MIGTLGVTAGALTLFPTGHLFAGTLVCWGFAMFDMLDGLLARLKGTTGPWGAFLDSTLDRIGDAAVFSGLAIWLARGGHQALLGGVSLYCLVAGGMVSYARAKAEGLGVKADVGVAERSERLLVALVAAGLTGLGVPYVLPIGLWAVAVASTVTFVQRVLVVRKAVGPGTAPGTGTLSAPVGPPGDRRPGAGHAPGGQPDGDGPAAVSDPGADGVRKDKA